MSNDWLSECAIITLKVKDVVTDQVQAARKELGLPLLVPEGGASHDFIQGLRDGTKPFLSPKGTPPKPVEKEWASSATRWRLVYLPPHNLVRQLSDKPICKEVTSSSQTQTYSKFLITLRDPSVPTLRVFVGAGTPKGKIFGDHRGVYFLRLVESLYVGASSEYDVRLSQHKDKNPIWWIFLSPEDSEQTFTLDTLEAAEALLISFWNEISEVGNQKRGSDHKPAFVYLQQAILLVEAASAVLLWLIREKKNLGLTDWNIPFKKWRSVDWPECYMKVPEKEKTA